MCDYITTCAQYLNTLHLPPLCSDYLLFEIAQYCSNLTDLCIAQRALINDVGIFAIVKNNTKLQKIIANGCFQLTDYSMSVIAIYCQNLLHLEIAWCSKITDESIIKLSEKCHKLRVLNVKNCYLLTDICVYSVLEKCKLLTHFYVYGLNLSVECMDEVIRRFE
jgi:hypothetical protein